MSTFQFSRHTLNRHNSFKKRHLEQCLISPAHRRSNKENCGKRTLIILSLIFIICIYKNKKIKMIIPTFRAVWKQMYYMDMIRNECQSSFLPMKITLKYIFSHTNRWLLTSPGSYTENQIHYHFVGSYIISLF